MTKEVVAMLPAFVETSLRTVRDHVRAIPYRGTGRICPVCGKSSNRFKPFGLVPREDAECAHCRSLERHRLLWIFLTTRTDLFDGRPKRVLHIAPEFCLEPRFRRRLGRSYLTADLFNARAMVRMDITDIQYPDESFDVIYCSHVLEHVPDDRLAMRELRRVLKSDGWAILIVPITAETTFEDPSIVDPQERLRLFGQDDHVRRYGPDYIDRLREAGFTVDVTNVDDLVSQEDAVRMGIAMPLLEGIYYCTK